MKFWMICYTWLVVMGVGMAAVAAAGEDDDTDDTVRYFHEHAGVVALHDESFVQAVDGSSTTASTSASWLILFHPSSLMVEARTNLVVITGDVPTVQDLAGVTLATMHVSDSSETMKRLQIQSVPSFVCIRDRKYYPYDGEYSWQALLEYCRNPSPLDGQNLPPPPSMWKHFRTKLRRSPSLQVGALIFVAVFYLAMAAIVGHFGGRWRQFLSRNHVSGIGSPSSHTLIRPPSRRKVD